MTTAERLAEIQAEQERTMGEVQVAAILFALTFSSTYNPLILHTPERGRSSFVVGFGEDDYDVTVTRRGEDS